MKFIVDQLPYYTDPCPFMSMCGDVNDKFSCPRYWDKCKVCSDKNPHECRYLVEHTDYILDTLSEAN